MSANLFVDSAEKEFYTDEQIAKIHFEKIPKHIAIIMDGNRRWARQRNLPAFVGHSEGAEVLDQVLRAAVEIGIETLTVYAFSTENWKRPQEEVSHLLEIFELYLLQKREIMVRDGVKLDAIGDLEKFPERIQKALLETKEATKNCDRINLVLALNYGGRDEICRAVKRIMEKGLQPSQVNEQIISHHLDTTAYGDPDLLIRTGGEMRISNFLLWQISYSEFYSAQVMWPDFSSDELLQAVLAYQERIRRLGG